jgi:hypothetical protein
MSFAVLRFPLSRYFRLRLSKHAFDADRNGEWYPLGENLKTYKVIPAPAKSEARNFQGRKRLF